MMSPFQIDLLNFMLTLAVWIPASLIWLVVSQFVFRRIASTFPGEDNRKRRSAASWVGGIGTVLVFLGVWWSGLLLTEGFRCPVI
jgi:hypothetical protein